MEHLWMFWDGSYSLICPMYCLVSFQCGTSLNWTCTKIASDLLVVQRDCTWKHKCASRNISYTWMIHIKQWDWHINTCIHKHTYIYIYVHINDICIFFQKQRASKTFTSCHSSTFGICLRNPSERWESKPAARSTSIFCPRDKVSKEWYVFLLKSVIPSSENRFSHGLSLKGKTQCFILSFSMEIGLFLAGWSNGRSWIRSPLSTEWGCTTQHTHCWLGLAANENLCHRPKSSQPTICMNALVSIPKRTFWKQIRGKIPDFQFDWKR